MESLIILLAVVALCAGPILAIMALISVRRLSAETPANLLSQLTARIFGLEKQVAELERIVQLGLGEQQTATTRSPEDSATADSRDQAKFTVPAAQPELGGRAAPPPPAHPAMVTNQGLEPSDRPVIGSIAGLKRSANSSRNNIEEVIGGRWSNRIGIVALLIAISSFLKWAFDNNWIGASGRVAIGALLGALMLPWSHWLLRKGYNYFSEGIAALGEATLFLSVWAGCQYYKLYSLDVGFAAMIAITAVMAAVAIGRNSQRIAVLSLLGGLLTPILASSGHDQQVVLFSYLLVLGCGALLIESKRNWKALGPIAFIGTQIYFWGWYAEFFHRTSPLERTVFFATIFYLLYSASVLVRAMRGRFAAESDSALVLLNSFAYSGTLFVLLWPDDKWPLTLLFLSLAAANVAVARLLPTPSAGQSATARWLYAGLSLTFLTLAIPVRLEGNWITLSFAVEGAILVWTGFRAANNFLRQSGYLLLALSALRLLFLPPAAGPFLFNARFGAYLVMVACFAVALWSAQESPSTLAGEDRAEIAGFAVLINIYGLIALSLEFWDYFGKAGADAGLAQHLSLSILWTAYAAGLLFWGVQKESSLLRWQSLVLFGLVVGKVFISDLSFLNRAYRILSFFFLGTVLLGVSFLYQRKHASERGRS